MIYYLYNYSLFFLNKNESNFALNEEICRASTKRRKELRKTRNELADEINVSSQTIWKWERNLTSPDVDEIFRLSKSLHCSVAKLFGESLLQSEILSKPELVLEAIKKLRTSGDITLEEILEAALIEEEKKSKSKR